LRKKNEKEPECVEEEERKGTWMCRGRRTKKNLNMLTKGT
jgi:hypothetical protein